MRSTPRAPTPGHRLSLLLRVGVALFVVGGFADAAYHVVPAALTTTLEPMLGPEGAHAHLATLVGMVAIAAGLVRLGVGRAR